MTPEELAAISPALETVLARTGHRRYREIIVDDALGCERCRRSYAALVLKLADSPWPPAGPLDPTAEELAATGGDRFECTCGRSCGCAAGACAVPTGDAA